MSNLYSYFGGGNRRDPVRNLFIRGLNGIMMAMFDSEAKQAVNDNMGDLPYGAHSVVDRYAQGGSWRIVVMAGEEDHTPVQMSAWFGLDGGFMMVEFDQ